MIVAVLKCTCTESGLCQRAAIVSLARIIRRDRHFLRVDCQQSVCCRYQIVSDCRLGSCRHRDSVDCCDHVRLCAYVDDRTVVCHHYREFVIVAVLKICRPESGFCQSAAVVCLARVFRCDRDFLCQDLQFAFGFAYVVVVGLEVLSRSVGDRISHFAFRYRRYASGRRDPADFRLKDLFPCSGHCYRRFRKRCAVIFLLAAF